MIKINEIKEPEVLLYSRTTGFIGTIKSYLQFLDIRVQIKEESSYDYYMVFNNKKILIDKYGELDNYPDGLYEECTNYLSKLLYRNE